MATISEASASDTSGLGFRHAIIENVFFVVWDRVLPQAMPRLLSIAREATETSARPLVYLTVIPDGSQQPDEAGRKALADATKEMLELFTSMHCAIEGTGFKKSIIRGVATSIFLLSGKRGKMHVHDTALDALTAATTKARASAILEEARRRGVIG